MLLLHIEVSIINGAAECWIAQHTKSVLVRFTQTFLLAEVNIIGCTVRKESIENVTNKYSKAVRPFATTGVFLGLLDYLGYLWK